MSFKSVQTNILVQEFHKRSHNGQDIRVCGEMDKSVASMLSVQGPKRGNSVQTAQGGKGLL